MDTVHEYCRRLLQRFHHHLHQVVLSEKIVILLVKRQVSDEPYDSFFQGPSRVVEELGDHLHPEGFPYDLLRHLGFRVSAGEMSQATNGWFSDLLFVSGVVHSVHESLWPVESVDQRFIPLIVARHIRESSHRQRDNIRVRRLEEAYQSLQKFIVACL